MTRKEEIEQASVDYTMSTRPNAIGGAAFEDLVYELNKNPSFIAGAEWADKTMIDKACKWLRSEARYYWGTEEDIDEMIADFSRCMKEQNNENSN